MRWQQRVEPEASAWNAMISRVKHGGLAHGVVALRAMTGVSGFNRSPADADRLLSVMVEDGQLIPVALDIAGFDRSQLAFRTLGPSAGSVSSLSKEWSEDQATLWTYKGK